MRISTGTGMRQPLASTAATSSRTSGTSSARGTAYSISTNRTRRSVVKTRCDTSVNSRAPSAYADARASGRTRPGDPAARAHHGAEDVVGEQVVVPPAPRAGQGTEHLARAVQRHPVVALEQHPAGVGPPVHVDVVVRRGELVVAVEHVVEGGGGLARVQREQRLRLQGHGVDHAERTEADPHEVEQLGVLALGAGQGGAVGEHQPQADHLGGEPAEPVPGAVRAGGDRAGDRLRLDVAEVGQREAGVLEQPVQAPQRHPRLHRHPGGGDVEVDQGVVPVEPQLHLAGDRDRAEGVAGADGPHAAPGRCGRGQRGGDLVGARRADHLDAVSVLVARPVAPGALRRSSPHEGQTRTVPTSDLRHRLDHATRDLDAPVAVVDLDAFDANADDLLRRASGVPVRVASKSLRCRALLRRVLARDGFAGVLAYSLSEALRLADDVEDVLVGYPTAERSALRDLVADERALARVTLMVDDPAQLDLVEAAVGRRHGPARCGCASTSTPRTVVRAAGCTSVPAAPPCTRSTTPCGSPARSPGATASAWSG